MRITPKIVDRKMGRFEYKDKARKGRILANVMNTPENKAEIERRADEMMLDMLLYGQHITDQDGNRVDPTSFYLETPAETSSTDHNIERE